MRRRATGASDIAGLRRQTIRPYSDLLLHDMGSGLADGRPDGLAGGSEWRTAPLWGIGLVRTVNRHTRFLHDGRARNLAEAILWHGGEAHGARERFRALPARERRELLAFLESL
ncbi:MAG TPA: di-heme oxidoredictase family protein [Solirubrobacteraceae bacterium]|nr:di-heme oxidoredictase family protein [Solirubrobacteraceae bacterium]